MASPRLKRKLPNGGGAVMGSASEYFGPHGGVFGLSPPESSARDGRKRRKDKLSWAKYTLTPYFDGHLWRKYGQKIIKDSPYPRLYFRCSYREDRHCLASKLVQQENHDDSPLFKVTYTYEHTCNAAPIAAPDVVAATEPPAASGGLVLSFGSFGVGHRRDARVQQERQQYHKPVLPPSPFMMNFDHSNGQLHEQLACFPSDVQPGAASWSPSFTTIESLPAPAPPSTDDEGDMFSTWDWDSFGYDLDDHLHVGGDHAQFPGNGYNGDDNYQ